MTSSYLGRPAPHYKPFADILKDESADTLSEVHAAMTSIPLGTGFCPVLWRQDVDVMLGEIHCIALNNKVRIIQLIKAYLNQLLRAAFARNFTNLVQSHKWVRSYEYGSSHHTFIIPILNKLITVYILIQKRTHGIFFDNDAKG
jgi:hypothetical protein